MTGSAVISDCGRYRYSLTRELSRRLTSAGGSCTFVMLNPSTADADQDDTTVRRCIGYATRWGFDTLHVVNLYAYRATNPRDLLEVDDPVGPLNDRTLQLAFVSSDLLVAAWGSHAKPDRVREILSWPKPPRLCLGLTRDGAPRHPLYLPADAELMTWPQS